MTTGVSEFITEHGLIQHGHVREETYGKGDKRVPTGFCYAVVTAPPDFVMPPGPVTATVLGPTTDGSRYYVPVERNRCKRGHPPLRRLSNQTCVYCERRGPARLTRVRVPADAVEGAREVMRSMGWGVEWVAKRQRLGGLVFRLRLQQGVKQSDIAPVLDALGWAFVTPRKSSEPV